MRGKKQRQLQALATAVVLCTTGIMLVSGLRPSSFSLFGAGNDFSLGILVGWVAGVGIGLALLLSRKCKPAKQ